MTVAADQRLLQIANAHPYPLLFATVSGAHLYGFPSPDSDVDLRGVHVLPLHEVIGLRAGRATIERAGVEGGLDLDLVTHDVAKFLRLLLRPNGYVLEQLMSPLVVATSPEHDDLRALGRRCITRGHARHYLGFAATQWRLFAKETPHRVKPLLYVYRVLLTGIHLMRTGDVQADLSVLNGDAKLPLVDALLAQKRAGPEHGSLDAADVVIHQREYERLAAALTAAAAASPLPDAVDRRVEADADDFLVRVRLARP